MSRIARVAPYLLIGCVALWLRTADLGVFLSGDEADFWIPRSERFMRALQSGNFNDMPVLGHPGVTTMWLGSAGIALRRALFAYGVLHTETYPVILALHRLPVALVHTLGVLVGLVLLRHLFPPAVAALAALLWATDPFVLAFSRVLHVDALAGTFVTLSLLAACVYWNHTPQRRWLVLSGVCAGLAVLSKSPALAVAPVVGVLALSQGRWRTPHGALFPLLAWGALCAITMVALWPAVWAHPSRVLDLLHAGVETEATSPHMLGNFFLGERTPAPGWLFYPVALVLRSTPWMLAGLLLLPILFFFFRPDPPSLRNVAVLVGFVLLFTLAMSIFPKKFNRYLEPVFPAADILAAVGIVGVLRVCGSTRWGQAVTRAGLAAVGVAAVVNAAWWHPYTIASFNQLLGGAQAGAHTFVIGWGEGYEQVADWINQQPDSTRVVTLSQWGSSLNPYLREGAQASSADNGTIPASTGYVVVYVRHVQGGPPPPPFDQFYGHFTPLHVVTIHGVEYAWIYQAPPPVAHPSRATFGAAIQLSGYGVDVSGVRGSGALTVTTQWHARASPPENAMLFLHVLDSSGTQVAAIDVPPCNPNTPTSTWEPGRFCQWAHPVPLAPSIPPGTYWVTLGLYHPETLQRLPLTGYTPPPGAPHDGADVLYFAPVVLP